MIDYTRLAALLAEYEADEPHFDEKTPYYPETPWPRIKEWLATEHCGDCTGEPCPCVRCIAEHLVHKARWLEKRLNE